MDACDGTVGVSREETGARLARLLAMVPWIAAQGKGVSTDELVARFGGDERRIAKDLELLGMVDADGIHTAGIWLEDDGRWHVEPHGPLVDPRRLTAVEGFAVLVAAKALLDVPGVEHHDALVGAITKLRRALEHVEGLDVDLDDPPFLALVQEAAENNEVLNIEYYSAARDSETTRAIEPLSAFNASGRWHLLAYCRLVEGERDFRVDRVRSAVKAGERFRPRNLTMQPGVSFQPAGTTAVVLEVGPGQEWVLEAYPVRDVTELTDGRWRLTLDVGGLAWLEQVLLRLGANARVVSPPELAAIGAETAARLLAAYD